ncbi:MAG: hypothetical protein KIT00_08425 [Rhodospirillales bacterium]|nr:hypothetical protein [Rhodospirillales bacterium]
MKAILLLTGGGPMVILTSFDSATSQGLIKKLEIKGIEKFVAHEIPLELAKTRYGQHFNAVQNDLHETDDLRVLDYNGERAFRLFHFDELGEAVRYESDRTEDDTLDAVRAAPDIQ